MRLEMGESVKNRRPYRSFIPDTKRKHVVSECWGEKSVMQALLESADHLYMAVILDGNRIRVTRFDDALNHWLMWWPWYQWYLKVKDQPDKPSRPEY